MQCACAVLCFRLWPLCRFSTCPHYLINSTIFGQTLLNIRYVFRFSLRLFSEIFFILKKISATYEYKCTQVFRYSTCYSCQILMELEFYPQIFEKSSNIKCHENQTVGVDLFHAYGQKDGRHNEGNSSFTQFFERAEKVVTETDSPENKPLIR